MANCFQKCFQENCMDLFISLSHNLAYDPPAVMNADTLRYCQREAWCKLAFYLLSFFYYLYWLSIIAALFK
uniref:Uncharacterized protein n=1 Tax=Laticauda laticaudata TaxID=8630 RepID=A0A8C5RE90_LATLA